MEEAKNTIVTVPQMVDLALNSPEIGIVNFTVLHSLLHVMVHQLNLTECSVEFRGSDSVRLQNYIKTAKPGPIITLKEYTVSGGEKVEVVEKGQADQATTEKKDEPPKTVVVVEPSKKDLMTGKNFSVGITEQQYHQILKDMNKLKQDVKELNELPSNVGLMDAIKSTTTPVQEMFSLMSIHKKVEAHDHSIKKLSSLIEDLVAENKGEGPLVEVPPQESQESSKLEALKKRVSTVEVQLIDLIKLKEKKDIKEPKEVKEVKIARDKNIEPRVPSFTHIPVPIQIEGNTSEQLKGVYEELSRMSEAYSEAFRIIDQELREFKEEFARALSEGITARDKASKSRQMMHTMASSVSMPLLMNKMSSHGGGSNVDFQEIQKKLKFVEDELLSINDMTQILWSERPGKQALMDMVQQTVDLLKNLKADREEMEEALQVKADVCMLDPLVRKEEFHASENGIFKLFTETNNKFNEQNRILQDQLQNLYEDIGKKLDSRDLEELRESVNTKLKALSEKIKAFFAVRNDTEAAGAKTKFIRNITCLSCDKDVMMRKEIDSTSYPRAPSIQGQKGMGPYLTYELDQLRQQKKCAPNAKSLNLLEHALHSRHDKLESDHICNRYCGGSHTTLTADQKVTRLGHFLNQWDPDAAPKIDETIRGTDGKMYRGHEDNK